MWRFNTCRRSGSVPVRVQVLGVVGAAVLGLGVLIATWPRDCMRTLVGPVPGGDPATLNPQRCTSVVGLPASEPAAYVAALLSAIVVLALFARSARGFGTHRRDE
jgi:hypothetical protein